MPIMSASGFLVIIMSSMATVHLATMSNIDHGYGCSRFTNKLTFCSSDPLAHLCNSSCSGGPENWDACTATPGCLDSDDICVGDFKELCPGKCSLCGRHGTVSVEEVKDVCQTKLIDGTRVTSESCFDCPGLSSRCPFDTGGAKLYIDTTRCFVNHQLCEYLSTNHTSQCVRGQVIHDQRRCAPCSQYQEEFHGIYSCKCGDGSPPLITNNMRCEAPLSRPETAGRQVSAGVWDYPRVSSPKTFGGVCRSGKVVSIVGAQDMLRSYDACYPMSEAGYLTLWKDLAAMKAICPDNVRLADACPTEVTRRGPFSWVIKCPIRWAKGEERPLRNRDCESVSKLELFPTSPPENPGQTCMNTISGLEGPWIWEPTHGLAWKPKHIVSTVSAAWEADIELEIPNEDIPDALYDYCKGLQHFSRQCVETVASRVKRHHEVTHRSKRGADDFARWIVNFGMGAKCLFTTGNDAHVTDSSVCGDGNEQSIRDLARAVKDTDLAVKKTDYVNRLQERELNLMASNLGKIKSYLLDSGSEIFNRTNILMEDLNSLKSSLTQAIKEENDHQAATRDYTNQRLSFIYSAVVNLSWSQTLEKITRTLDEWESHSLGLTRRLESLAFKYAQGSQLHGDPLDSVGLHSAYPCWITSMSINSQPRVQVKCMVKNKNWLMYEPVSMPIGPDCEKLWAPDTSQFLLVNGKYRDNSICGEFGFTNDMPPQYSYNPLSFVDRHAKLTPHKRPSLLLGSNTIWIGTDCRVDDVESSWMAEPGTYLTVPCNSKVTTSCCQQTVNWMRTCGSLKFNDPIQPERKLGNLTTSNYTQPVKINSTWWVNLPKAGHETEQLRLEYDRTESERTQLDRKIKSIEPSIQAELKNATAWANKAIDDLQGGQDHWNYGLAVVIALVASSLFICQMCCKGGAAAAVGLIPDGDLIMRVDQACAEWDDYLFLVVSCITTFFCIHFLLNALKKCKIRQVAAASVIPAVTNSVPQGLAAPIKVAIQISNVTCPAYAREILAASRSLGILTAVLAIVTFVIKKVRAEDSVLPVACGSQFGAVLTTLSLASPKMRLMTLVWLMLNYSGVQAYQISSFEHEAKVWFILGWTFIGLSAITLMVYLIDRARGIPSILRCSWKITLLGPLWPGNILLWRDTGDDGLKYVGKIRAVPETVTPFCTSRGKWSIAEATLSMKQRVNHTGQGGQMMCITNGLRRKIRIWDVPEVKAGKASSMVRQAIAQRAVQEEINAAFSAVQDGLPEEPKMSFPDFVRMKQPKYAKTADSVLNLMATTSSFKTLKAQYDAL